MSAATLCQTDYELIAESIPHIVWVASPEGRTEYFNRRGTDYTGLPPETNYDWEWLTLIHPDDVDRAQADRERGFESGEPQELEYRIRRFDGGYRWMAVRAMPVRGDDGQILKWIGTCTDIEEQKRLERSLVCAQRQTAEALTVLETLQSTAPVGFGFVDREFRIIRINEALAELQGAPMREQLGMLVRDVIPDLWPELEGIYRSVLETGEKVLNHEVSGRVGGDPTQTRHCLTSYYPVRLHQEIIGIGVVVVDITERKEAERARSELTHAAVAAIAATVEARDPYTAGHERRVGEIAGAIATEIGISADEIEGIVLAANIHDIGKIGVPAEILSRPGRLRPAEFELVKDHSRAGYEIVAGIKFPWPVATMILQHHERFDGSGYPDGCRGDAILIGARILAVADVVEAMASHRPYRPTRGLEAALEEIANGSGTLFDPVVAEACLGLFREGRLSL